MIVYNCLGNLLSILSLGCGFGAIIFALEEQFTFASWTIILSVIFDGLDGQVARKNPQPSQFGKELDSLIDAVSFGMAPAVLGYIFIYREFYLLATLALFTYLLCCIVRLAKYNITPKDELKDYFLGLPTTVSGGVLAAFILIFRETQDLFSFFIPGIFIVLVLLLAFLMISQVKYLNLDGLRRLCGKNFRVFYLVLAAFLLLAGYYKKAGVYLFLLFLIYLIFSPLMVKRLADNC